jgi:hypothetical protein
MDKRWTTDMSAMVIPPGRARRMSPPRLNPSAAARSGCASSPSEPREAAEGGFLGGGDARPVRSTAEYPFQDVIAQRDACSKGRTLHPMVNIGRAEGRATVALHCRGVGGQLADAKAVAKAGADFSAIEFESIGDGEGAEPCRGRAASAAGQAQLGKRANSLRPSFVQVSKDSHRALTRVCAACREKSRCAAAIVSRLSGLTTWYSGGHRVPALPCRAAHRGQSCVLMGPSNGRKASGPVCMACWAVTAASEVCCTAFCWAGVGEAEATVAKGEGLCSNQSGYPGRFKMAEALSTSLISAHCTVASTCMHPLEAPCQMRHSSMEAAM